MPVGREHLPAPLQLRKLQTPPANVVVFHILRRGRVFLMMKMRVERMASEELTIMQIGGRKSRLRLSRLGMEMLQALELEMEMRNRDLDGRR